MLFYNMALTFLPPTDEVYVPSPEMASWGWQPAQSHQAPHLEGLNIWFLALMLPT